MANFIWAAGGEMHLMPVLAIWINKIMLTHIFQIFKDVDGDRVANTHGEKNVLTREICPVILLILDPKGAPAIFG